MFESSRFESECLQKACSLTKRFKFKHPSLGSRSVRYIFLNTNTWERHLQRILFSSYSVKSSRPAQTQVLNLQVLRSFELLHHGLIHLKRFKQISNWSQYRGNLYSSPTEFFDQNDRFTMWVPQCRSSTQNAPWVAYPLDSIQTHSFCCSFFFIWSLCVSSASKSELQIERHLLIFRISRLESLELQ